MPLIYRTSFYKSASCPEKLTKLRREAKESIGEVEDLIPKKIAELKTILEQGFYKYNFRRKLRFFCKNINWFIHVFFIKCIDKELVPHPSSFDDFYLRCLRAKKYDVERAANLVYSFTSIHGIKIKMPKIIHKIRTVFLITVPKIL